jgi:hypothetical protein
VTQTHGLTDEADIACGSIEIAMSTLDDWPTLSRRDGQYFTQFGLVATRDLA